MALLARPLRPDLKLVSFQRAAIRGVAIQAYVLNAPVIYTELETWRVTLSEEVDSAVSTGAIPGGTATWSRYCCASLAPALPRFSTPT